MLVMKNHNYHVSFFVILRKRSFLASVNDGGDRNGIGGRMEEKINEIAKLVKKKKFKKNRKQVLRLLNELSTMTEDCEAPPTSPPDPGRKERERVGLTSLREESLL